MKSTYLFVFGLCMCLCFAAYPICAQDFPVVDFDEQTEGPWSDIDNTTFTIPKVNNGQVVLDASISASEYGGFEGIDVIPGTNAWILNFATVKDWQNADDASFTFYVSYDDTYLYVGVEVKDDVVRSNDPNPEFWKDDAIELVIGPENNRYDLNTDGVPQDLGGHIYFNYEGRFSAWDEATQTPIKTRWAISTEWEYGEDQEVYGVGQETPGGWTLETRMHKVMFEDADYGALMQPGEVWDFDIGIDDDDGADLALQYWWASRVKAVGFEPDNEWYGLLSEEEIATRAYLDPENEAAFWELRLAQPLSFASAGEMILGELVAPVTHWSLY